MLTAVTMQMNLHPCDNTLSTAAGDRVEKEERLEIVEGEVSVGARVREGRGELCAEEYKGRAQ